MAAMPSSGSDAAASCQKRNSEDSYEADQATQICQTAKNELKNTRSSEICSGKEGGQTLPVRPLLLNDLPVGRRVNIASAAFAANFSSEKRVVDMICAAPAINYQ